jgi:hypothetical protein
MVRGHGNSSIDALIATTGFAGRYEGMGRVQPPQLSRPTNAYGCRRMTRELSRTRRFSGESSLAIGYLMGQVGLDTRSEAMSRSHMEHFRGVLGCEGTGQSGAKSPVCCYGLSSSPFN